MTTIYALYDDREPDRWRYIGQTANAAERLIGHRSNRTAGIPGENLAMAILEVVEAGRADESEQYWITRCALEGYDLANRRDHPDHVDVRVRKKKKLAGTVIHLDLSPEAIALLNKLAGGERRKSDYIERIIPILYEATEAGKQQQTQAIAETLAAALTKDAARD